MPHTDARQKALTAAAVARMKADKDRQEIPDGGCPGLYLVIQPGGAKSWALRFRRPDGRPAKLTLGSVYASPSKEPDTAPTIGGHLTLAAAHRLVSKLKHELAQGRDPAAAHILDKAQRRATADDAAANTFTTAARDFIEQHARPKVRRWYELARLLGLKPDNLELIPKGLAERWAERPVTEIDGHDVYSLIDECRRLGIPGSEARTEGPSESRARKMFSVLSKMFAWLMSKRRVATHPCAGMTGPEAPEARDRVLSNAEIAEFWRAADIVGKPSDAVVKLLLLTGCRLREVAGMRAEEFEQGGAIWNIPGSRTKNGKPLQLALPPLAREILASVPRIEGCEFVFSTNGRSPVQGWTKTKARLDRAMKSAPWRLHDLRRTAATGMAELGIMPHIVEAVLNHVSGARAGVAGTYNRAAYAPEKKAALERWAAHVEGLVSGKSAKVIPMRGA